MRRVAGILVLAAGLGGWAAAASHNLAVVQFVPVETAGKKLALVDEPASYDRPTSTEHANVEVVGQCSPTRPRGIDLVLRWVVKGAQVEAQRVDLSLLHDGFSKGSYLTSGTRPSSERGLVFSEALPGVYYYWRLLIQSPAGWVVSGAGRVDSPICPVDEVAE